MTQLLRAIMVLLAGSFFVGAYLHTGHDLPLGFTTLDEPRIGPAAAVETICGIALLAGAILAGRSRSPHRDVTIAHAIAIAGVILGMVALAAGRGPRTESNDMYHAAVLAVMVFDLLVLLPRAYPPPVRSRQRFVGLGGEHAEVDA